VITLPCGAGKTIVAMVCMARLQTSTLILTTSVTAARQWKAELLDKTSLLEDQIAEYSGDLKQVRPVTIATYQIMTWRPNKDSDYPHLMLFDSRESTITYGKIDSNSIAFTITAQFGDNEMKLTYNGKIKDNEIVFQSSAAGGQTVEWHAKKQ
jgi:hypothetical protein